MQYIKRYVSPLGSILISCDDTGLNGLWFENSGNFAACTEKDCCEKDPSAFEMAIKWLDIYFSGKSPDFIPPLSLHGTDFQKKVWEAVLKIPYGKTASYGDIADKINAKSGKKTSARAVGGAVARNKILLIIPCHRVVGSDGSITGYVCGTEKKAKLLEMEKIKSGVQST